EPASKNLTVVSATENIAPTASIDSVQPNPAEEGETVAFEGSAADSDGTIISYSWESSIDGLLSNERTFSTSSLSVGEHVITFKVEDNGGAWSEPAEVTLTVKEKEEEGGGIFGGGEDDDTRTLAIALGVVVLILIVTLVSILTYVRKKKAIGETVQVGCPGCGIPYNVTSPQRPVTVQCPSCGMLATINQ
ncbi:MAG: PKD domain-containing protein, partial [Thermoplasmata archaeon]